MKLLELVSNKIYERFKNLRCAFRYLDTDHSNNISITEFAQAIEHLRIKISFDDVKTLFTYMDKAGRGAISYNEFTLLDEEKWRRMNVSEQYLQGKAA
jgi:Ca2+-binding EF-hand superfamily protein